jgi:hypothetical protein
LLEREKKRESRTLSEIFFLLLCCSAGYEESERERVWYIYYMGRRWGVEEEGVAWKARRVHCSVLRCVCSVIKVQRFNASGV